MTEKDNLKDVQEHEEYLEAKDGTQVFMRSWLPQGEIEHVVFAVHGQCVHSATFRKWASAFGERKIATFGIDLRGYGNTGMRGDAKDFYLVTEDITMALSAIRARYPDLPVSLLSWSMGVSMVLNTFDQCELDPSTVILIAGRVQAGGTMSQMLGTMAFIIKSFFVSNARFDFWSLASKTLQESELGQLVTEDELCTKRVSRRMLLGMSSFMTVKPIMRGAARISVPTLIIHGEGDMENPPNGSRQLYENLTAPQKKLVMIPYMDHDLDGLSVYMGPGLKRPLTSNASRVVEEIVAWVRADHA